MHMGILSVLQYTKLARQHEKRSIQSNLAASVLSMLNCSWRLVAGPTKVDVEEACLPQQVVSLDLQCPHMDSEDDRV